MAVYFRGFFNALSANPTNWSNTHKQFVGELFGVIDHFVGLALKGLRFDKALRTPLYIF